MEGSQSSKNKKEILPAWPYMTLEEFVECTNIVEIVRKYILTNGPNPGRNIKSLGKYVEQAYTSFLKPKQRSNKFFKDFKIQPKPWLTKNDGELLVKFNINSCYVNLEKTSVLNKRCETSMQKNASDKKPTSKPGPVTRKVTNETDKIKNNEKTALMEEIIELSSCSSDDEPTVAFHPIFKKSKSTQRSNLQRTSEIAEDELCKRKQEEDAKRHHKPRPKSKQKQNLTNNIDRSLLSQNLFESSEPPPIATQASSASQDIAKKLNKSTEKLAKIAVKILPREISFEDFRKKTNIKSVVRADIVRRHPEQSKKILLDIEKHIYRYYTKVFITLKKWPDKIKFNDRTVRTLDDLARLKKNSADEKSNNTAGRESDNVRSIDILIEKCNSQLSRLPQEIDTNKMAEPNQYNDGLLPSMSIATLSLSSPIKSILQQQSEIVNDKICESNNQRSTEDRTPPAQEQQQSSGKFKESLIQGRSLEEATSAVIKSLYPNLDSNKVSRVARQFVKIKLNEMRSEKSMKCVNATSHISGQIRKEPVESAESTATNAASQDIVQNPIILSHSQPKVLSPSKKIAPSNQQEKIIVAQEQNAKVKILPSDINLEDLRDYTNVEAVIRDDIILKYPEKSEKLILKIEKHINKYHKKIFIKLKSWPNLIKFNDATVQTLDDLARLKRNDIGPKPGDAFSLDIPISLPQPPEQERKGSVTEKETNKNNELHASPDIFPSCGSDDSQNIELSKTEPFLGIVNVPRNQSTFTDHAFNTSDPLNITICQTLENVQNENRHNDNELMNKTVEFILPDDAKKDSLKPIKIEIEEDATQSLRQLDSLITDNASNEVHPVMRLTDRNEEIQFQMKQQQLLALQKSIGNSLSNSFELNPESLMGRDSITTHCNQKYASEIVPPPTIPIETNTDLVIKEELSKTQYSEYGEEVELIPNVREETIIIDDVEPPTVDNLLHEMMKSTTANFESENQSQSQNLQNRTLQNDNEEMNETVEFIFNEETNTVEFIISNDARNPKEDSFRRIKTDEDANKSSNQRDSPINEIVSNEVDPVMRLTDTNEEMQFQMKQQQLLALRKSFANSSFDSLNLNPASLMGHNLSLLNSMPTHCDQQSALEILTPPEIPIAKDLVIKKELSQTQYSDYGEDVELIPNVRDKTIIIDDEPHTVDYLLREMMDNYPESTPGNLTSDEQSQSTCLQAPCLDLMDVSRDTNDSATSPIIPITRENDKFERIDDEKLRSTLLPPTEKIIPSNHQSGDWIVSIPITVANENIMLRHQREYAVIVNESPQISTPPVENSIKSETQLPVEETSCDELEKTMRELHEPDNSTENNSHMSVPLPAPSTKNIAPSSEKSPEIKKSQKNMLKAGTSAEKRKKNVSVKLHASKAKIPRLETTPETEKVIFSIDTNISSERKARKRLQVSSPQKSSSPLFLSPTKKKMKIVVNPIRNDSAPVVKRNSELELNPMMKKSCEKNTSLEKSARSPVFLSPTKKQMEIVVNPIDNVLAPVVKRNSELELNPMMKKSSEKNKSLEKGKKLSPVFLSPTQKQMEIVANVSAAIEKGNSELELNLMKKSSKKNKSLEKSAQRSPVFLSSTEKQMAAPTEKGNSGLESNPMRKTPEKNKSSEKRAKRSQVSPTEKQMEIVDTPIENVSAPIEIGNSELELNPMKKSSEKNKSLEKGAKRSPIFLSPTAKQMKIVVTPIKNTSAPIKKGNSGLESNPMRKTPEKNKSSEKGTTRSPIFVSLMAKQQIVITPSEDLPTQIPKESSNPIKKISIKKRMQASADVISNDFKTNQQGEQGAFPPAKIARVVSTLKRKNKEAVVSELESSNKPARNSALPENKTTPRKRRIIIENANNKVTKPKLKKRKKNSVTENTKTADDFVQQIKHNFGPLKFVSKTRNSDDPQIPSTCIKSPSLQSQESIDRDYLIEDASLDITPSPVKHSSMTNSQLLNGDETYFRFLTPTKIPPPDIAATTTSQETSITISCPEGMKSSVSTEISARKATTSPPKITIAPRSFTKPILDILKIPKPMYNPQYAYMTYLSLSKLNFISGIDRVHYENCIPFLQNGGNHFIQALIKFQRNGHYTLDIFGQSLRFLLGLTNIEWNCFISLLELFGNFEYTPRSEEPFEKSLPLKILYYFFKTLPKFSQVTFEYECEYSNAVRCVSTSLKYDRPIDSLTKAFDPFILRKTEELKKYISR